MAGDTTSPSRRAVPATFSRATVGLGLIAYAIAFFFAARHWDFPEIGPVAALFLGVALAAELLGKVLFAVLFQDALARQGHVVTLRAAIYASLVGTAVARLIPAGGALTPSAMAWAMRAEDDQTAGAALRTALVSYGGLVLLTGVAIGWGVSTGRHPALFAGEIVVAVLMVAVGVVILAGSRWLAWVVARLPRRLRRHFGPTAQGHATPLELALIAARVVLEALVLWSALRAFGIELSPSQAMVAFGVSTVVGGLPLTPGGIGLIEGGLVGVLAGFGFRLNVIVAPVLLYRVIDYWIAAAVGILAAGRMAREHRRADEALVG